jgi:16S rRNA processing protein RimM
MGRTAGSTSSTSKRRKRPKAARSEPKASEEHQVVDNGRPRLTLGRVVGAHGLRGELRVRLLDETDNNLRAVASVWLAREEGDPKAVEARVRAVGSGRRGEVRLSLEGVDGREAAEALRGRLVLAFVEQLAALPDGEYYQYELIGCRVEHADGRAVGVVAGIWETGAPAVLVVVDEARREHLIPAASEIVREVDLIARRIVIDAPPGLLDEGERSP